MEQCPYCCHRLPETVSTWCPTCRSRLQPLSLMPGIQVFSRFGARFMDICLFGCLMAILAAPILWLDPGNALLQIYIKLCMFTAYFVLLPVAEAFSTSMWGLTPGKWLFKLEVLGPNCVRPSFAMALRRACLVYHHLGFFVLGMVILCSLTLMFMQQAALAKGLLVLGCLVVGVLNVRAYLGFRRSNGHTQWDAALGLRVQHRVLRFEQLMMALLSYFLIQAASDYFSQWPTITPHPSILM
jgi:uncharacterized RDD family membrane protein YckC